MALTSGMLNLFKALASDNDERFIEVFLSNGTSYSGYLREVGTDYFVIEEYRTFQRRVDSRGRSAYAFEEVTEKVGKSVLNLNLIESWTEKKKP
jgi:hypothetical protein